LRESLSLHHGGGRVEALYRFSGGDAVTSREEGEGDII
jgi:hypothetical protein